MLISPVVGSVNAAIPIPVVPSQCVDVRDIVDSAIQMYAPVRIELDYQYASNRDGDFQSVGFTKNAGIDKSNTQMLFHASENGTYLVWFHVSYDQPIRQNVTLLIQEGDRPVQRHNICMNGTTIFLEWGSITIVPEPNYPTPQQMWNYGETDLKTAQAANQKGQEAIQQTQQFQWGGFAFVIVLQLVIISYVLSVRRRLSGRSMY